MVTWLMRLMCVFNFNLLGHIAQPPRQGRTTVRGRQTHGLYCALRVPECENSSKIQPKKPKRQFIATLSHFYRNFIAFFFCEKCLFSGQTLTFSHSNAKNCAIARRFVANASHDKCWLMTLSKSKLSGHTMCLLVARYATTSPIFASSQRSIQSKLSKNWLVGTRQPT